MLKIYKKMIGMYLMVWVIGIGVGYFTTIGDERIFIIVATSILTGLVILMTIVIDKNERLEKSKELRIHRLIHATIDGVVEIQKSKRDHTYRVYTDTDAYMVEYGEASSKIIHMGDYQRIEMEG